MVTFGESYSVCMFASPVGSKTSASGSTVRHAKGYECTEGQPISIAILGLGTVTAQVIAGDAPEDHINDPNDEGGERG